MKNILFIGHSDKFYGAESVLLRIIKLVSLNDYKTHVVLPVTFKNDFRSAIKSEQIKANVFRSIFRVVNPRVYLSLPIIFWNIISAVHLIKYTRDKKIDIIYANTCLNIIGAYVAFVLNKKLLWHFHEQPTGSDFKWIPRFLFPLYRYLLKRKNTTIIFISHIQKNLWEIELQIKLDNSIVLYTPPRKITLTGPSSAHTGIHFGFLGTFTPPKNIIMLISMFKNLNIKYPDQEMKLIIMGDGPMYDEIKGKIIALKLSNNVSLLKHQSDVKNFFNTIDILVLPSIFESWGLTALEAMSLQKAVIVTKNTALTEILDNEKECLFIDPSQESTVLIAMERLLIDPEFRKSIIRRGSEKLNRMNMFDGFEKNLLGLINEN